MCKSLKFVLFALSFVGSGPSDALGATHPFSPVPMFVCHGCQVSAVPCLPRAALCVLCVMVLGVPAAIIPEHSQAEPGGGSHLLLLFLMDNLEGESKRERDLEGKMGIDSHYQSLSLFHTDYRLLKAAVCVSRVKVQVQAE